MPRVTAVLAVAAAVMFCIGYNAMHYPAVWDMVAARAIAPPAEGAAENKPTAMEAPSSGDLDKPTGADAAPSASDSPYCTADRVCAIGGPKPDDPQADILSGTRADRKHRGDSNSIGKGRHRGSSTAADSREGDRASPSLEAAASEKSPSDTPSAVQYGESEALGAMSADSSAGDRAASHAAEAPKRPAPPQDFSAPGAWGRQTLGPAETPKTGSIASGEMTGSVGHRDESATEPASPTSSIASLDVARTLDRPMAPLRRETPAASGDGWEGGDTPSAGQAAAAVGGPASQSAASGAIAAKLRRLPPVEPVSGEFEAHDAAAEISSASPAFRATATP